MELKRRTSQRQCGRGSCRREHCVNCPLTRKKGKGGRTLSGDAFVGFKKLKSSMSVHFGNRKAICSDWLCYHVLASRKLF